MSLSKLNAFHNYTFISKTLQDYLSRIGSSPPALFLHEAAGMAAFVNIHLISSGHGYHGSNPFQVVNTSYINT